MVMPPLYDVPVTTLDGRSTSLRDYEGRALLIVNVASRCVLTPQYEGLERLHEAYSDRGFSVVGVPSNQFGAQEPGTAEEIQAFCSTTYGVTFPMLAKTDVNGGTRHPLYQLLTATADEEGKAGDVVWNFEKFLVSPAGEVVARFRPGVTPDDDKLVRAVEQQLPA